VTKHLPMAPPRTFGDGPTLRSRWGHIVAAVATLAVGLTVTIVVAAHERSTAAEAAARSFNISAGNVTQHTRLHLSRYAEMLEGFQALHREAGHHGADFGHDLAEQLGKHHYPGYAAVIVALHEGPGPAATTLTGSHIEPHRFSPADLGLAGDNLPAVEEAMRRAAETGLPVMTSPLQMPERSANLALFAPLYRGGITPTTTEERRADSVGWVGVVFRTEAFFNEVLVRSTQGLGTEVFDGTVADGERVAIRPRSIDYETPLHRTIAVAASGRLWSLRMQALPTGQDQNAARIILIAGILLSVLLAVTIGALGGSKNRAVKLVKQMTGDLRRSEQRFRSLATASPLGIFSLAADGHCEYVNERLCQLTGRTPEQLRGDGLSSAYHPDDRAALRKAVTGDQDRYASLRLRVSLPDGTIRWVKTHAAPLRDDTDELTGWVGSVEDVTAEVEAQIASQRLSVELAHQARHDHLTGLPNRTFFTEQVTELLGDGQGVAVLFFDIDRFKVVNDSLGHGAGDRLLVAIANRLRDAVRPGDLAARFGGDEFVVGLVDVPSPDDAVQVAERLATALNHTLVVDGHEVTVTVSMGVAVGTRGADVSAETLLTQADSAMYRAKARGRARVELYRPSPTPVGAPQTTLDLERQLRQAVERDELRLVYQPIAALGTGRLVGVEALIRWEHPTRGLLGPGEFIPLAEESGLIIPVGAWVLRQACAQLHEWRSLHDVGADFSMTINVSAVQLADRHFCSAVATALADHGLQPGALCLEITESALLADIEMAEEALRDLRALGVRIAVDDFGTGYSSLSHLKVLPVDMLKIDRSFIRDLGVDAGNTAIVGAVIRLANALGLTCVGEGVEEPEQLTWLASLGCGLAQGFHLAMPQPASAITALLAQPAHPEWQVDEDALASLMP